MHNFYSWLKNKRIQFVETQYVAPKVLWITGMGSTGVGARELASMGYEVKQVGTTTNRYAAYLGWLNQFQPMHSFFGKSVKDLGQTHLQKNVSKHDAEMKDSDFVPDVVVGTSQGGALVMQVAHNYPHSKFVLGAPAWNIFGANPSSLPRDTIIIHGMKDKQVLPRDSFALKDRFGYELRTYDFGHTIPTDVIKDAVDTQLKRMGITVPKTNPIVN